MLSWGRASPEGVVTARIGSLYQRLDSAPPLYAKASGAGKTGWAAIATVGSSGGGTGGGLASGRVVYTDSGGQLTTDAGLNYTATGHLGVGTAARTDSGVFVGGTLNAVTGNAIGAYSSPTLVATADNYNLVGVSSTPLFNGASKAGVLGIGVYGRASAGGAGIATAYGIYGEASGATTNWAGFFGTGDVKVTNGLNLGSASGAAAGEIRASNIIRTGDMTGYGVTRVVTVNAGATSAVVIPAGSYGFIWMSETNSIGCSAGFAIQQASTYEIFDQAGVFSNTSGTAGSINFYHNGTTGWVIQNNRAGTVIVRMWCLHTV